MARVEGCPDSVARAARPDWFGGLAVVGRPRTPPRRRGEAPLAVSRIRLGGARHRLGRPRRANAGWTRPAAAPGPRGSGVAPGTRRRRRSRAPMPAHAREQPVREAKRHDRCQGAGVVGPCTAACRERARGSSPGCGRGAAATGAWASRRGRAPAGWMRPAPARPSGGRALPRRPRPGQVARSPVRGPAAVAAQPADLHGFNASCTIGGPVHPGRVARHEDPSRAAAGPDRRPPAGRGRTESVAPATAQPVRTSD